MRKKSMILETFNKTLRIKCLIKETPKIIDSKDILFNNRTFYTWGNMINNFKTR
ncbi:hypothetical protein LV89_02696 [Arcicella aurantiaca]|uniref:Uncharacterized protein n=1 Tax=Arcicella aurantiaca TaxID=591202 RepID=A0A316E891_9BACT|nr:hypothetical protein LV89_02696 [Arcicella aurantiaca]